MCGKGLMSTKNTDNFLPSSYHFETQVPYLTYFINQVA